MKLGRKEKTILGWVDDDYVQDLFHYVRDAEHKWGEQGQAGADQSKGQQRWLVISISDDQLLLILIVLFDIAMMITTIMLSVLLQWRDQYST